MVKIKIVNRGRQQLPAYATELSAGMDLRANIDESITLNPMEHPSYPQVCTLRCPRDMRLRCAHAQAWHSSTASLCSTRPEPSTPTIVAR